MKLTDEQTEKFEANGFLYIKNFLDTEQCDEILSRAVVHANNIVEPVEREDQFHESENTNSTIRRLRQVYDREEIFARWMNNHQIRPALKQLLKEDPVLVLAHHNSIMTKFPHKSSVTRWHQDIRYWNYKNDNLISIWLSLGEEYIQNGVLEFIPGSHKMNFKASQFDEKKYFREDTVENSAIISRRVHSSLNKGDIVIFHARTLHYAHKNITDKPKISFVYSVRAKSNQAIKNTTSDFKEVSQG